MYAVFSPVNRACVAERREVGVVGQDPVDLDGEAGCRPGAATVAYTPTRSALPRDGLEHDRRAGRAAGLEVEHHAAVGAERVVVHERLRPAQAGLLGVGEQQDESLRQRRALRAAPGRSRAGSRCRRRRRCRRRTPAPSRSARPGTRGRSSPVPGSDGDHVARRRPCPYPPPRAPVAPTPSTHLGLQAEVGERVDEVVPHVAGGRAARRVDLLPDALHVLERPLRAERVGGRVGGGGCGRPDRPQAHRRQHHEEEQG